MGRLTWLYKVSRNSENIRDITSQKTFILYLPSKVEDLSYKESVRKHKQLIIIVVSVGAILSYLLPLDNLFAAGSGNANANARASILAGLSHTGTTNPAANSANTGSTTTNPNANQGNPASNPNTGSGSNSGVGTANTGSTNPNARFGANQVAPGDTTFQNGNSAQIGTPGDNGNVGHGNTGHGNIGNGNQGNGNIGNFNRGNGHVGNFCENGNGQHGRYECSVHNPNFRP